MAGQIIKRGERKYLVRMYVGMDEEGRRKYYSKTVHGSRHRRSRHQPDHHHRYDDQQ